MIRGQFSTMHYVASQLVYYRSTMSCNKTYFHYYKQGVLHNMNGLSYDTSMSEIRWHAEYSACHLNSDNVCTYMSRTFLLCSQLNNNVLYYTSVTHCYYDSQLWNKKEGQSWRYNTLLETEHPFWLYDQYYHDFAQWSSDSSPILNGTLYVTQFMFCVNQTAVQWGEHCIYKANYLYGANKSHIIYSYNCLRLQADCAIILYSPIWG